MASLVSYVCRALISPTGLNFDVQTLKKDVKDKGKRVGHHKTPKILLQPITQTQQATQNAPI